MSKYPGSELYGDSKFLPGQVSICVFCCCCFCLVSCCLFMYYEDFSFVFCFWLLNVLREGEGTIDRGFELHRDLKHLRQMPATRPRQYR